ncbi:MAG: nuclear transport factor 2 family protein [Balneolaceae bacterium]|nr:MAG: nuclear transport factor 2 family protein [Balneolaceae bacterium]
MMDAQQTKNSHKEALEILLNDFLAGASVNSFEIHNRFWAEDLIYTSASGERFGKAEIMAGLSPEDSHHHETNNPHYYAEDIQISIYGNAAIVAFRLVAEVPLETGGVDILNFYNTGTFIYRNEKWRAVAWQATATD